MHLVQEAEKQLFSPFELGVHHPFRLLYTRMATPIMWAAVSLLRTMLLQKVHQHLT